MNQATKDDLKDILDFIAEVLPFSALDSVALEGLARQLQIEYIPERSKMSVPIDECVFLIRTGAFEIVDEKNRLVDKLSEGDCFGLSTLLHDNPERLRVYPIEDSLVYRLPKSDFLSILNHNKNIRHFFEKLVSYRTKSSAYTHPSERIDVQHTMPVDDLIQNKLVYCDAQSSIREAAEIMRENKVSCLLLIKNRKLEGIVTDRDLRNRVVADGLDVNGSIDDIATKQPTTINSGAAILEAQILMSNIGIHHLPIMKQGEPIGVITATDIVRVHSISIVHFVDRIFREKTSKAVALLQQEIPSLLDHWIEADVSPLEIGDSFAVIGDGFVRKAIALALAEYGPAPMRFAWMAFGSQARKDQSFASDQDNGLILERPPIGKEEDYFEYFSHSVCQMLDSFGYVLCPGDIMASNNVWRKTSQQWFDAFEDWIETPKPEALLNASIFFDMRLIYGPDDWLDELKQRISVLVKKSELFLMHMTRNALRAKPPLGFFRSFIVNDSGEHEHELDIKHQGIALINDMARILALAEGRMEANTIERLTNTGESLLQKPAKTSLIEAWLLLNELKLECQMTQIKNHQKGSNYINPDQLSPLRRAHLKNSFKAIERAQKALSQHYLRGTGA